MIDLFRRPELQTWGGSHEWESVGSQVDQYRDHHDCQRYPPHAFEGIERIGIATYLWNDLPEDQDDEEQTHGSQDQ